MPFLKPLAASVFLFCALTIPTNLISDQNLVCLLATTPLTKDTCAITSLPHVFILPDTLSLIKMCSRTLYHIPHLPHLPLLFPLPPLSVCFNKLLQNLRFHLLRHPPHLPHPLSLLPTPPPLLPLIPLLTINAPRSAPVLISDLLIHLTIIPPLPVIILW